MLKATIMAISVQVVLLSSIALGQQPAQTQPGQTQPAAAAPAATATPRTEAPPEYVDTKGFKNKIFEIKNRDPRELTRVLGPLGSGFRGAIMTSNDELKTITVRDFPENIAVIEEALNRLDQPVASPSTIEFHVHILVASNTGTETGETPAELTDVLRQLHSTLPYKSYVLVSSSLQRANNGSGENHGTLDGAAFGDNSPSPGDHTASYDYHLNRINHVGSGPESYVQINDFRFNLRLPRSQNFVNVGFTTPVIIHNGEKVVVGSSTVGDRAVIVVILANSAR